MRRFSLAIAASAVALAAAPAFAGLVLEQKFHGTPLVYANGGGAGFGGRLGPGSYTFSITPTGNLRVEFANAGPFEANMAVLYLDTRAGGVLDPDMNDVADGGRRAVSSPMQNGTVNFPIVPDFGLAIGGFGAVLFELVPSTNLTFHIFNAAPNIEIPLSLLGNPLNIDFFSLYTSDTAFLSNETLPAQGTFNTGPNPGFAGPPNPVTFLNYNRFIVPEPAALSLLIAPAMLLARGSRRR